ncbi:sigma-70 family RNA polymerase sigma factor [Streptomyces sp. Z423-1]|uniref:sigma-70 family RNA polymerase sigma factor n=1 Tax=unclassified Streptomyces TaxID=2593676 RepID=UPI001F109D2C|nr:sigma-70 family RNA polymerase sigma factor [Streptomyces sp. Z423-1]
MITPALPAPRERTEEYENAEEHEKDEDHEKTEDQENAEEHENADDSITAWALAARAGDPDAVDRFVRALHRDVLRYVAHLCADPQAVDDLAQDTFLRALGSLHRFEGRSSARAWLLSIARRAVIDSYRYAAARPRLSDVPDWRLAVELAQPRDLPGFDDGIALLDLLAALPEERREAFVLTQLLGLPYAEAAALSDCPIGTVRSRVNRARATLIDLLTAADEPAVLVA